MSDDFKVNDSAAHAPDEILRWAKKITQAQGCEGILAREVSGYHLYIPCPECLHTHGRRELDDPKYSINLSMLAGLGDAHRTKLNEGWSPEALYDDGNLEKKREYGSSICMRTRSARTPHRVPIEELLHMGTITSRHPDIHTQAAVHGGSGSAEKAEMWEEDLVFNSGQMVPPPPGETVSLTSLPAEHPAVVYLTRRGYDIQDLQRQFGCSFCTKEYPYGEKGIYYRKMPGGWKDSPQHRVIFHSLIKGAPLTWQARVIEKLSDDELNKFMLHPYAGGFYPGDDVPKILRSFKAEKNVGEVEMVRDDKRGGYWMFCWSHVATRSNPEAEWIPMAPFDEMKDGALRFQPSKYRTAKYSSRQLMGWDAALQRAEEDSEDLKWIVLCEGPLDAARVGSGGVATIGSSISPENAKRVAENFHIVFMGYDDDKAGRQAHDKISRQLMDKNIKAPILANCIPLPIPQGKDLGDLRPEEFQTMFRKLRKRAKRSV